MDNSGPPADMNRSYVILAESMSQLEVVSRQYETHQLHFGMPNTHEMSI